MVKVLDSSKMYRFEVCMFGYGLSHYVNVDRLDMAVCGIYDLYLELGIVDEPLIVNTKYVTYRVYGGVVGSERTYSLRRKLKGCVRLVSDFVFKDVCKQKVSLSEFIKIIRSISDEKETRLENIGMTIPWSR